jgi:predicted RNA binding protein YcfA (HicA-like mRNA interferase family)
VNPPLPTVSGAQVVVALRRAGFSQVSQRGSHVKLRADSGRIVIVPLHRELRSGMRSIIRQSGLDVDAFVELLR